MGFRSIGISFCWAFVLTGFRSTGPKPPRGVDLCKNVGGGWVQTPQSAGEMQILNSAVTKHRHRKKRRYFCYVIGDRINVDSC